MEQFNRSNGQLDLVPNPGSTHTNLSSKYIVFLVFFSSSKPFPFRLKEIVYKSRLKLILSQRPQIGVYYIVYVLVSVKVRLVLSGTNLKAESEMRSMVKDKVLKQNKTKNRDTVNFIDKGDRN